MSSSAGLSIEKMQKAFLPDEMPGKNDIILALDALKTAYESRPLELKCISNMYYFQTRAFYSPWILRLHDEKPPKYSKALLETLAIIAYKQPVTRGDIENIRGITVNPTIMKTLMEREWIKQAGFRDVPGRPALYVTTDEFLRYFNLDNITALDEITL